ncbi:MAG: hypothetical protein KY475_15325, partial [Planctomycetes bacterium]|nr:hypothetical protein [Planctomycetota bacterium]
MRSIPHAMTWEVLRRGHWQMLAALLAATALPMMLFAALRTAGPLEREEPYFVVMHLVLMLLNMVTFGAALLAAQGRMSWLYALPAANSTLAAWRLAPAMVLMAVESAVLTAAINAVFDLGWPLWGPALFLAVAWAAVQAAAWLTQDSAWLPWTVAAVIVVLAMWFKSQYGPLFSQPTSYWRAVTAADAAVMLAVAGLSFGAAVWAMARNRRGDPPASLGMLDWLGRLFDRSHEERLTFASPAEAQLWYEWRRKGWVMPAAVAFALTL